MTTPYAQALALAEGNQTRTQEVRAVNLKARRLDTPRATLEWIYRRRFVHNYAYRLSYMQAQRELRKEAIGWLDRVANRGGQPMVSAMSAPYQSAALHALQEYGRNEPLVRAALWNIYDAMS